jgi:hypothetical protein
MKTLSRNEMKSVMGGNARLLVCTCGNETVVCSYSSFASGVSCTGTALSYCSSHAPGAPVGCDY